MQIYFVSLDPSATDAHHSDLHVSPYTDAKSFTALSQVLEGVGAAAYTGAAQSISNKAYVTVAASILSTEARHATYVASTVNGMQPWSSAFEVGRQRVQ